MSKTEFIAYLRNQLIPDLIDSGKLSTAQDFETACRYMSEAGYYDDVTTHLETDEEIINYCNAYKL